jgi:hypothetical protein
MESVEKNKNQLAFIHSKREELMPTRFAVIFLGKASASGFVRCATLS